MKITVESIMSGKRKSKELNVIESQILAWQRGMLIQEAMPELCPEDRDFIKGIFWDELGWS